MLGEGVALPDHADDSVARFWVRRQRPDVIDLRCAGRSGRVDAKRCWARSSRPGEGVWESYVVAVVMESFGYRRSSREIPLLIRGNQQVVILLSAEKPNFT